MKYKITLISILLILLAGALSACTGSAVSATSWPGLAANEQYAFVAYTQYIYAVNLADGGEAWRYPEKAQAQTTFFANPALTPDGQLLAPSYNHKLYSLNPANGNENWVFEESTDRLIASPLVTEQGIFQVSADGNLYALDFGGHRKWIFETGGPVWASPASDEDCTCLFVASMDHHVYAVDAITGDLLWQSDDLNGAIVGTPAFDHGNTVIVGTFGSEVIAMDAETGRVSWRFPTEGWVWSSGLLYEDSFYFGDIEGYFYSIDAATGRQNWRLQPGGAIIGSPLLANEQLIVNTENDTVYTLSLDGDVLDSQVVSGTLYSSPYAAGGLILIAPIKSDIILAALTPTGAQQWTYMPGK
jgi:outer membrane protein assembly factor BamB